MKCCRKIYGKSFARAQRLNRFYKQMYWKKSCAYTTRCRSCARAEYMVELAEYHTKNDPQYEASPHLHILGTF